MNRVKNIKVLCCTLNKTFLPLLWFLELNTTWNCFQVHVSCQFMCLWLDFLQSLDHGESEVKVKVTQSCLTLCDPMDYRVHGILQARILEWVVFPFSTESSHPRQADSLPAESQGKPKNTGVGSLSLQLLSDASYLHVTGWEVKEHPGTCPTWQVLIYLSPTCLQLLDPQPSSEATQTGHLLRKPQSWVELLSQGAHCLPGHRAGRADAPHLAGSPRVCTEPFADLANSNRLHSPEGAWENDLPGDRLSMPKLLPCSHPGNRAIWGLRW